MYNLGQFFLNCLTFYFHVFSALLTMGCSSTSGRTERNRATFQTPKVSRIFYRIIPEIMKLVGHSVKTGKMMTGKIDPSNVGDMDVWGK